MKPKLLLILLLFVSLFGYLEWGTGQHTFLYQAEFEIFTKIVSDPMSVLHPFVVLPLLGQLLLIIALLQHDPNKLLVYCGIGCIGVLMLMVAFIGVSTRNPKIALSAFPFIVLSVIYLISSKKQRIPNN